MPKETEPFELICTSNVGKDLGHLMGSEYDAMKERQDNLLKFQDYWLQPSLLGKSRLFFILRQTKRS